jgi:hypothetical protein
MPPEIAEALGIGRKACHVSSSKAQGTLVGGGAGNKK